MDERPVPWLSSEEAIELLLVDLVGGRRPEEPDCWLNSCAGMSWVWVILRGRGLCSDVIHSVIERRNGEMVIELAQFATSLTSTLLNRCT